MASHETPSSSDFLIAPQLIAGGHDLASIISPSVPELSLPSDQGLLLEATFNNPEFLGPLARGVELEWSVVSSPAEGEVTFEEFDENTTGARFSEDGEYVIRLTARAGPYQESEDRAVQVGMPYIYSHVGSPVNTGGDQNIDTLQTTMTGAINAGTALEWRPVGGFNAAFSAVPVMANTSVEFERPGVYRFLLIATNANVRTYDDLKISAQTSEAVLLPEFAPARVHVPTSEADDATWFLPEFDDSQWISGDTGIGYETAVGFQDLINTDVESQMFNLTESVYIRIPIEIPDAGMVRSLQLGVKYDDGFIAYLNGIPVARKNAPTGNSHFKFGATGGHPDIKAVNQEQFDLAPHLDRLVSGTNLLAIHGLNAGRDSSDLLILPELTAEMEEPMGLAPRVSSLEPESSTSTGARFQAYLESTGGSPTSLVFLWGEIDSDGGVASPESAIELGVQNGGRIEHLMTSLLPGRTYFYRVWAGNEWGDHFSRGDTVLHHSRSLYPGNEAHRRRVLGNLACSHICDRFQSAQLDATTVRRQELVSGAGGFWLRGQPRHRLAHSDEHQTRASEQFCRTSRAGSLRHRRSFSHRHLDAEDEVR